LIRSILVFAALVGATAVAAGAYTAHGFESALVKQGLAPELIAARVKTAEIASRYHLVHAVALLALAAAPPACAARWRTASATLFLIGLLCFSGILYAKAFFELPGFNLVVPFGGMMFILGWLALLPAACTSRVASEP
jgi:uncharacterized membrane protein YgdD (TMEM256/DUF423 family)